MNEIRILHINDIANIGPSLVVGLKKAGIYADFMNLYKLPKKKFFRYISIILYPFIRLFELIKIRLIVNKRNINIVHLHYALHSYLIYGLKVPYYIHIHGSDIRLPLNSNLKSRIIKHGILKAKKVFYSTPDLKKFLNDLRADAIFFPTPIEPIFFQESQVDKKLFPEIDIMCISKIDNYKGITEAINTIQYIWSIHPYIKVGFFNFGNAIQLIENFFNNHIFEEKLVIFNHIPFMLMPSLIKSSKIILGQLEIGALGSSELEAMACGKPVICKYNYSDVYEEPPPIINFYSYFQAGNELINLLNNKELREDIGMKSRIWVHKYHNMEKSINQLIYYYKDKNE